jgi:hypothetical protein
VWAPEVEHRDVLWRRVRHVVLSAALVAAVAGQKR